MVTRMFGVLAMVLGLVIGGALVAIMPATPAKADPGPLATYSFTSPGWATFGIALPSGEARDGLQVGSLATQTDVKNRWPDGSIRYAILTTHVTTTGSYAITAATAATGSFTPVVPRATLTLNVETAGFGSPVVAYTSDVPATPSSDLWLNGPLVKEWRVLTAPQADGVDHPFLTNIWDVRVYDDGTGTVDATVENVRDVPEADGVVYGVDISVNGAPVYHHDASKPGPNPLSGDWSYTSADHGQVPGNWIRLTSGPNAGQVALVENVWTDGFETIPPFDTSAQTDATWETVLYHQYGSRWHRLFGTQGFVAADVVTDFAPFVAAGAVPQYLDTVPATTHSAVNTDQWQSFDLMGYGVIFTYAWAPGARPDMYLYPEWAARYMVHGTKDLRAEVLAYGDISGNFASSYTKSDPAQIVTLDEKPNYWLDARAGSGDKPSNNMQGSRNRTNNSHKSSLAYIPYLVTGDRYYNDQMMFDANWAINNTWPGATPARGSEGMLWGDAPRGFAWGLRDVIDAAFYLPDTHPYKAYFTKVMDNNLAGMDEYVGQLQNPLQFYHVPVGNVDGNPAVDPWQLTYLAWVFDHAIAQNDSPAGTAAVHNLLNSVMGAFTNAPSFLPEYAASYHLLIGTGDGSGQPLAYYTSWAELFDANFKDSSGAITVDPPPWVGYYGPEMRVASILGKKYGIPGAEDAYNFTMAQDDLARGGHVGLFMESLNERSAFAIADYTLEPTDKPATVTLSVDSNGTNVHTVVLNWVAPIANGTTSDGRAASYDVRYSTSPITEATFDSSAQVDMTIAPQSAGNAEVLYVNALETGKTYYFAEKSINADGVASEMSNVVSATAAAQPGVVQQVLVSSMAELQDAINAAPPQGVVITVKAGDYTLDNTIIVQSKNSITIQGATDNPADTVIRGDGMNGGILHNVYVNGSSYLTVKNLTLRDSYYHGIQVNNGSQYFHADNLELWDNGESAFKITAGEWGVEGTDQYSDYGLIENCHFGFTSAGARDVIEGIDGVAAKGWVVRNNVAENVRQTNGSIAYAMYFKGNSIDSVFVNNTVINSDVGISFGDGSTGYQWFRYGDTSFEHRGGLIANNVIKSTALDTGLVLRSATGFKVYNNTVWNGDAYTANSISLRVSDTQPPAGWATPQPTQNGEIVNNIFRFAIEPDYGTANQQLSDTIVKENNLAGGQSLSTALDPALFVDAANGDFHLADGATQAIGHGTNLYADVPTDFDGNSRPATGAFDIGAYQKSAATGSSQIHVRNQQELLDAVAAAHSAGEPTEIIFDNDIPVDQTIVIPSGTTATFTSSYNLEMTANAAAIGVDHGASLTIDGIAVTAADGATDTGIVVDGDLVLAAGSITGHSATQDGFGGGVTVNDTGTFTVTGGTISNNTASLNGGGVMNNGTLTISACDAISGNRAANNGGGVYNGGADATFTMDDCTISNNTAAQSGGGVYSTDYASFAMTGGEISGNTANVDGGGVWSSHSLTMSGGVITGNTSPNGGGIFVTADTGNSVVIGGTAQVTGNTFVSGPANNITLPAGVYISVGDGANGAAMPTTMLAGVTKATDNGVIVASGASAGDTAFFTADAPELSVLYDNGQIRLGVPTALESITVTTRPAKTAYTVGDSLDLTGLVVTATYSDDTTADVTADVTTSPAGGADLATVGSQTVTVTYVDGAVTKTAAFEVTVAAPPVALTSIAVTTPPSTSTYSEGEALSLSGLVLMATFSDGSTADVTQDVTTSPADGAVLASVGTQTVTVSYERDGVTKTATFQVSVTAAPVVVASISVSPSPLALLVGGTGQATAMVGPSDAADKSVTWSSSDPSVAGVDASGKVTGVGTGTATITATANDGSGVSGSTSVTVTAAPVTVASGTLWISALIATIGDPVPMIGTVVDENGVPLVGELVTLSVSGSATISAPTGVVRADRKSVTVPTGANGVAQATVTDATVETVTVTAALRDGRSLTGSPTRIDFLPKQGPTVLPPPVIATPADGQVLATATPQFSGTGTAGSTVTVSDQDGVVCVAIVGTDRSWACTPSTPLAGGSHTIRAVATDTSGAVSSATQLTVVVQVPPVDTPKPGVRVETGGSVRTGWPAGAWFAVAALVGGLGLLLTSWRKGKVTG